MRKHAYLIMIHEYTHVLQCLLELIDDKRNDIYIHVDKKLKIDLDVKLRSVVRKSSIFFAERVRVNWGGYSMIAAEMNLLKMAISKQCYQYYHLLSGADLPLKTQDEIHDFFSKWNGYEFVDFQDTTFNFSERIKYYYFFQEIVPRICSSVFSRIIMRIQKLSIKIQRKLSVHRNSDIIFQKGANWFSITDAFARLVVDRISWIRKRFKWTFCADELLIQTIFCNFAQDKKLYGDSVNDTTQSIMRFIDWGKGNPYVFMSHDYERLISSNMLFARKFSDAVSLELVDRIVSHINSSK